MSDRAPSPSSAPPTTAGPWKCSTYGCILPSFTKDGDPCKQCAERKELTDWRRDQIAKMALELSDLRAAASPPSPALEEFDRMARAGERSERRGGDGLVSMTWRELATLLTALRSSASALAEAERERGELRDLLRRARARAGEHDGRGDALRLLSRAIELLAARAALAPGHLREGDADATV